MAQTLPYILFRIVDFFDLSRKQLKSDSHPPKGIFMYFIESPSKVMKNAFYFILKALFLLKIFKFLS